MTLDKLIITHYIDLCVVGEKAKRHIKIVAVAIDAAKTTTCSVGRGKTVQQAVDNLRLK